MRTGPSSLLFIAFTLTSFAGLRSLRIHPSQVRFARLSGAKRVFLIG